MQIKHLLILFLLGLVGVLFCTYISFPKSPAVLFPSAAEARGYMPSPGRPYYPVPRSTYHPQPWPTNPHPYYPSHDTTPRVPDSPLATLIYDGDSAKDVVAAFGKVSEKPRGLETKQVKKGGFFGGGGIFGSVASNYKHEQLPALRLEIYDSRRLLASLTNINLTQKQFEDLFDDLQGDMSVTGSFFNYFYSVPANPPESLQGNAVAKQVPTELAKRWHETIPGVCVLVQVEPNTDNTRLKDMADKANKAIIAYKSSHSTNNLHIGQAYIDSLGWHDAALFAEYATKLDLSTPCYFLINEKGEVLGRLDTEASMEQLETLLEKTAPDAPADPTSSKGV